MDVGKRMDDRAQAREVISTPVEQHPLPKHPLEMWTEVAERQRPSDATHLAALAAEHDAPTDGHGWYWLGRAMLAASLNTEVRSIGKLRAVLNRWRSEETYGSDAAYERQSRPADVDRRGANDRPARQPAAPRHARRQLRPGERGYIQPDE